MLGGSTSLFLLGGTRTQDEEGHTIIHGIVPLFAAVSYFAMAVHQGEVTLPSGRVFLYARYVDWSVTTPALLLGLFMVALRGAHRRAVLVAGLLVSDIVMMLTGLFFGLSEDPFAKWVWYVTSCVAFAAVHYILLLPLIKEASASDAERRGAYRLNLPILGILWLVYPVFVVFGPDGLGLCSPTLATAAIVVLDLTAKIVYAFIAMGGSRRETDGDLARGEVSPASISTHAIPSGRPVPAEAPGYPRSRGSAPASVAEPSQARSRA